MGGQKVKKKKRRKKFSIKKQKKKLSGKYQPALKILFPCF